MMTVLTEEEEVRLRRESFSQLAPGDLFSLSQERCFIMVHKGSDTDVDCTPNIVIELTPDNRQRIIEGRDGHEAETTHIFFSEMACLRVWKPPSPDSVKLKAELRAFKAMTGDLVRKYPGMFVAVHKGQVIDSDVCDFQLAARIDDMAHREGAIAICRVPENGLEHD